MVHERNNVEVRLKPYLIRFLGILLLAGTLCGTPAFAAGKGVVLNFNDVDISTMVKFISDLTGKNFVLDDRVKGKVSIFSPSKLSIEEAYNVFTSVLELKGFTVVPSGKVLKVIPSAGVKTSAFTLLPSGERSTEKYEPVVTSVNVGSPVATSNTIRLVLFVL